MKPKITVTLTAREQQTLAMTADGMKAGEIAEALGITMKTVCNHLWLVTKKAGAKNRFQLICFAMTGDPLGATNKLTPERINEPTKK